MLRFALPAVFWAILVSTKVRSAFSTFGFLISTWIELSMTCPYKLLISYETLIFNLRL